MEVKDQEEFEQPQKMLARPHKRDQQKYYRFHRDHGHDTDECIQLKDEIETLIQRGRLARFVAGQLSQAKLIEEKNMAENSENNRPTIGVITTICRGAPSVGSSESRQEQPREKSPPHKKARTQDVIAFTDEDLREVWIPHDDPIIVFLMIANFNVKKILVDNGSSMVILFYGAFQRIKLSYDQLQKINALLVGSIESSVQVEEAINYQWQLGLDLAKALWI